MIVNNNNTFTQYIYALVHKEDVTHHRLCYTSCEAQAGTKQMFMGTQQGIDPTIYGSVCTRSTLSSDLKIFRCPL